MLGEERDWTLCGRRAVAVVEGALVAGVVNALAQLDAEEGVVDPDSGQGETVDGAVAAGVGEVDRGVAGTDVGVGRDLAGEIDDAGIVKFL